MVRDERIRYDAKQAALTENDTQWFAAFHLGGFLLDHPAASGRRS